MLSALYAARLLLECQAGPRTPVEDLLAYLPDPEQPVVLRLGVGEQWCRHCGAAINSGSERCCARPDLVDATSVLSPESYYLAN